MAKVLEPATIHDLSPNPSGCKFKRCQNEADWFCYNPEIHWSPVGICERCLGKMRQGYPYVVSYYSCGRRKDIVEIEFRDDVNIQFSLFNDEEDIPL